jgi:hypothetical protein
MPSHVYTREEINLIKECFLESDSNILDTLIKIKNRNQQLSFIGIFEIRKICVHLLREFKRVDKPVPGWLMRMQRLSKEFQS